MLSTTPKYPRRESTPATAGGTPAHESFASHPCSVATDQTENRQAIDKFTPPGVPVVMPPIRGTFRVRPEVRFTDHLGHREQEAELRAACERLPFDTRLVEWNWSGMTAVPRVYVLAYRWHQDDYVTWLVCFDSSGMPYFENGHYGLDFEGGATDLMLRVSGDR